jgi:hypothetical protein
MDPVTATIAAGAAIAGQGINAMAQGKMNKKTRQWNEKMYARQREDALADWARTNDYNAPLQQMARLKQAGLNPNLVYDKGADNTASMVRGTEAKSWDPKAPAFDLGQVADQYFGAQRNTQSVEYTKELIKGKQLENTGQEIANAKNAAGLPYVEKMLVANLENKLADTKSKQVQTSLALNNDARQAIRSTDDHEIAIKRALNIMADTASKEANTTNAKAQLYNIQETRKLLQEQGKLAELTRKWKEVGLSNNASRLEWLTAQYLIDPKSADAKLQQYIQAMGKLAVGGAKQAGQTIAESAKSLWDTIFGSNN